MTREIQWPQDFGFPDHRCMWVAVIVLMLRMRPTTFFFYTSAVFFDVVTKGGLALWLSYTGCVRLHVFKSRVLQYVVFFLAIMASLAYAVYEGPDKSPSSLWETTPWPMVDAIFYIVASYDFGGDFILDTMWGRY